MASTYTLISSNVLGSNAASVTFSSITQTYTDLLLQFSVRTTRASNRDQLSITLNNTTSSVTGETFLWGSGSAVNTGNSSGANNFFYVWCSGATATANTFGAGELYIPTYSGTTINKNASVFSAAETNNSGSIIGIGVTAASQGLTAAISTITIASYNGADIASGSSFYLYGIKNS